MEPDPDVLMVLVHALASKAIAATTARTLSRLVKLEHRHESLLRDLDRSHSLHPLLPFLLLLQELALARDVAAVTLRKDIFAHRRNRLACDDLAADGGLKRNYEHLTRDDRLQLLDQLAALDLSLAAMHDQGQRVDGIAGHEHVELDEVALPESDHLVVHRRI